MSSFRLVNRAQLQRIFQRCGLAGFNSIDSSNDKSDDDDLNGAIFDLG